MGSATGDAGYFQRSSLFWFTLISFGLGCFTVLQDDGEVGGAQGRRSLLPCSQTLARAGHGAGAGLLRVDCLLAPEYPLSEPWAPGFLHEVLGGPSLHPLTKWVLAHLADSLGRVLICHGIMQI